MNPDILALLERIVFAVFGAFASVAIYYWGRERKLLQDSIDARFRQMQRDLEEFQSATVARFDHASRESSKLTSIVQAIVGRIDRLPDDMRTRFLSLDVWEASKRTQRKDS